jgi:nucleoside 2-deoxyribosyltransferase
VKNQSSLTIVISGSFRKHLSAIQDKAREFENAGFMVLSPAFSKAMNPKDEFVFLESDKSTDKKQLEEKHLHAIGEASALYVFNPDGNLGNSAQMEMGFALALGKPVYSFKKMTDATIGLFCAVATPEQIRKSLQP